MSVYLPETENIYFPKTREYFKEVLSSYASGNYRSAIVMLYSVAICDILFKLQELKDMFNDSVADEILREVDKMRNAHDNKSKSKWEKELLDNIYNKTKLLDLEAYTNLNHLYDHRNFSAHPALNENYELIMPSKETTIAHIKNTLNDILIKPPIFIKNVIDTLTEDLKERGEIYQGQYKELSKYLKNKYYCKMPDSMKLATLKAFWKFCFCSPDNEDCMDNIKINRMALEILIDSMPDKSVTYIQENPNIFTASVDDKCMTHLAVILSSHEEIYPVLSSELKFQIDSIINKKTSVKLVSWFKYSSLKEHLQVVKTVDHISNFPKTLNILFNHYKDVGESDLLIDYFIDYYSCSRSYDTADKRFKHEIQPFLDYMAKDQLEKLISVTNDNDQIYGRGLARSANAEIARRVKAVFGANFDYSPYPHFLFDADTSDEL